MTRGISFLLWIAVFLCTVVAAFLCVNAFFAQMAPAQGASAALGAAVAVIPYVAARAWDEMCRPWPKEESKP